MMPRNKARLLIGVAALLFVLMASTVLSQEMGDSIVNLPLVPNGGASAPYATATVAPTAPPGDTPTPAPQLTPQPTCPPAPTCPTPSPGTPVPPPKEYRLEDVVMTLERTVCFGTCPAYTVEVHGDGLVHYEGRRFVREVGVREDRIKRDAVVELLEDFYEADFFDLMNRYLTQRGVNVEPDGTVSEWMQQVTDLPSQIVTIKIGKYEKRVVDYWSPPAPLRELEGKIDEAAGTAKWVGP